MSEIDRALCRKAAAECIELARVTTDSATKQVLLTRSQEWLKLAYEHDGELERVLTDFNDQQMGSTEPDRPLVRGVQQQPMQQQQTKAEEPDKEG